MANITGPQVLGREIMPGDEIINEWEWSVIAVEQVHLTKNTEVKIIGVRESDGSQQTLKGGWDCKTRLLTRKERQYKGEGEL